MNRRKAGFRGMAILLALIMTVEMALGNVSLTAFASQVQPENTPEVVEVNTEAETVVSDNDAVTPDADEEVQQDSSVQPSENVEAEDVVPKESTVENEQVQKEEAIEEATIELDYTNFTSSVVYLTWSVKSVDGLSSFGVYRDENKIATVPVTGALSYTYNDTNVILNESYNYQIYGLDADGNQVSRSETLFMPIVADWTVSSDYTLTETKIVRNLNVTRGKLTLDSSCELIVLGDVLVNGTSSSSSYSAYIDVNKGFLECKNFKTGTYGALIMRNVNGYLRVKQNFTIDNTYCQYTLEDGVLEIGGDFTGNPNRDSVFVASKNHRTILNGTKKQTLTFSEKQMMFNILEVENASEEGVYCEGAILAKDLRTNGNKVDNNIENGQVGWTLEGDYTHEGDLVLIGGTLDLAGYELNVKGNLIQASGDILVNGGTLNVEKDYYCEYVSTKNSTTAYKYGGGCLKMMNEEDHVKVGGLFKMGSIFDHSAYLTNGILEVKGDVIQKCYSDHNNFISTNNFTLLLSGDKAQTITLASTSTQKTSIANLEIANTSEEGVSFGTNHVRVSGLVKSNGSKINGYLFLLSSTEFADTFCGNVLVQDNITITKPMTIYGTLYQSATVNYKANVVVEGDYRLAEGYAYLNGTTMTVKGNTSLGENVSQSGDVYLYPQGGTFHCDGNVRFYNKNRAHVGFYMNNANDKVYVGGDLTVESPYGAVYTAGELEIKGNFTQKTTLDEANFVASDSHTVILSGEKKQTVSFATEKSMFNKLVLENHSADGIFVTNGLNAKDITWNDCKVTDSTGGITGYLLEADKVIEGDVCLASGEMNLNGKKLTVTGDLIQVGGTMNINGGTLEVKGNYILLSETKDDEGAVINAASKGYLLMTNEADKVIVDGDFHFGTNMSGKGKLTAGILEVKGDVKQYTYVSADNFATSDSFKLLLSGDEGQEVSFENTGAGSSCIANLEITNTSEEGVSFDAYGVAVTGLLKDNGNKTEGYVLVSGSTVLDEDAFGGNIKIVEAMNVTVPWKIKGDLCQENTVYYKADIEVDGNFILHSGIAYLQGNTMTVKGNADLEKVGTDSSAMYVCPEKGYFYCGGNVTFHAGNSSSANVGFYMNNAEDRVCIGGNFTVESRVGSTYTAGTIELKGDFTQRTTSQGNNFYASGSHTTILNGDKKQTIDFSSTASTFYNLDLQNYSDEGIYVVNGLNAVNILWNNCMVTDSTGGSSGYVLEKDTVIDGDLYLSFGEMDLNGHTLTVKGKLVQAGGVMNINKGQLITKGSYYLQTEKKNANDSKPYYNASMGSLIMTNKEDKVIVGESFFMGINASSSGKLTNGVLEVKGDVYQYTYGSANNFLTTDGFKLLLSGEGAQKVSFSSDGSTGSRIANLEITNESKEGVAFGATSTATPVSGELVHNGNTCTGYVRLFESSKIQNNTYGGSVVVGSLNVTAPWVIEGDLRQEGTVYYKEDIVVNGNYNLVNAYTYLQGNRMTIGGNTNVGWGTIYLEKGLFHCDGNVTFSSVKYYDSRFYMTNPEDMVYIGGDFTANSYYSTGGAYTDGVIEIKGNFTQQTSGNTFYASKNHTVILSGDKKQTVRFVSDSGSTCNILELRNTSSEGVYFDCIRIPANELRQNNTKIRLGKFGMAGWTLSEDEVLEGDVYLVTGDLDLNGHKLSISGNLYVGGGNIKINGGTLDVGGDLRYQAALFNENGSVYQYSTSKGYLTMVNSQDRVLVGGDFVTYSVQNHTGYLTDGILEVKGDFSQSGGSSNYFYPNGNHKIILSGSDKQNVIFERQNCFNELEITNTSSEGVVLGSAIWVQKSVSDPNKKLSKNYITHIPSIDTIQGDMFGGNVEITNAVTLSKNMEIGGVIADKDFNVNGYKLSTGDFTITSGTLKISKGSLYATGTLSIKYSAKMNMTNAEDYVFVNESFVTNSNTDHTNLLTAGTLEIRGDFEQIPGRNSGFVATADHKTVLSGKAGTANRGYIQSVKFGSPGVSKFNHLVLNKELSNYSFTPSIDQLCADYVIEEKDNEAPAKVTGIVVAEPEATKVTLSWDVPTDNEGVTGYEVYRGTEKVAITSKPTFTDTALSPETTYVYKVVAFDAVRNVSEDSETIRVTTPADTTAPSVPSALKVKTKTGSAITIVWNASTDDVGVTGYKVYRDDGDAPIAILDNVTTYKDTDVEEDHLYSYQVLAFDKAGNESQLSDSIKGSIAMPEIMSFTPIDHSDIGGGKVTIRVYYKNVGNSTGNKVKFEYQTENDSGEKVWEQIGGVLYGQQAYSSTQHYSSCTWNFYGVKNGACKVRATLYDADGNTDERIFTYYVDTEGPDAPDEVRAKSIDAVVTFSWAESDSEDCVNYKVYRSEEEEGKYTLLATTTNNSYEDKQVETGKTYYYKVSGVDRFNQEGALSKAASVEVTADREPPKVTEISADKKRIAGAAPVIVRATDNIGIATICLEYQDPVTQEWVKVEEDKTAENGIAAFTFDTRNLKDGTYKLRAIAKDKAGNPSAGTFEEAGMQITLEPFYAKVETDNTGIEQIKVTEATGYPTYVTLKWNNVPEDDFSHFVVEQKNGEAYTEKAKIYTTLGTHIQGLTTGTTYTFRVVGYDNLGNRGIPSEDVTVTTTADTLAPIVKSFYPAEKYFNNTIPLTLTVNDNVAVKSLELKYSTDYLTWSDLAVIEAKTTAASYTFNYSFDVSQVPEGKVYIRAFAYDTADNVSSVNGQPIENCFNIDRTAPVKVTGLKAEGKSGYNALSWNKAPESDIREFRIYRAEEEIGNYSLFASGLTTNIYYDTAAKVGVPYSYKVQAVDHAGNVSEYSEDAVAQSLIDDVKPVVHAITPEKGSRITKNAKLTAVVSDNVSVRDVLFEYKAKDSEEDIWTELGTVSVAASTGYPSVTWDVSKFDNKEYEVRITATDYDNNVSAAFVVSYVVDTVAPEAAELTGEAIGFGAKLSWEMNEEEDFSHYILYRKLGSDESYTRLKELTETTYEDYGLLAGRKYQYQLRTYDKAGNYAVSSVLEITPTDEDKEAPVAVTSETYSVRMGSEVLFDATASHDNVKITEYKWELGDGQTAYGAKVKYRYKEMGTYTGKLTVTDSSGNTDSTTFTVRVRSRISAEVSFKIINQSNNLNYSLGYAYVYIESELGEKDYYNADEFGELKVVLPAGRYTVDAYKEGYMPKSFDIVVANGDEKKETLVLEKGELVTGKLTATRLTLEQIQELGVDLQDPNNWYTYTYTITYTIPGTPERKTQNVVLRPNTTTRISTGSSSGSYNWDGDYYVRLTEVEGKKVVTVYRSVSFLKKMYDVCLQVTNNAEDGHGFDIVNSKATLNLPAGLSLLKINTPQSLTNEIGTLAAQETKETHWYIKADAWGSYDLSADFSGTLLPFEAPVQTRISADEPLVVSQYEDNTFTDDGFATDPTDYVIRVINKQGARVKGAIVTLQFGDKQCQTITNSRGTARLEVNKGDERNFNLTIQHDDYILYNKLGYGLKTSYTDTIRLYREGESQIEEEDDEEENNGGNSPFVDGYDIALLSATMDGKSLFKSPPKYLNRAEDKEHSLDFVFSEKIKKYELILEGDIYSHELINDEDETGNEDQGWEMLASESNVNDSTIHIDLNVFGTRREGKVKLKVYAGDMELTYNLDLTVNSVLYDKVQLTYETDIADLLTEAYNIYTYYKDAKIDIECKPIEGSSVVVGQYQLVQGDKIIARSNTGKFNVKVGKFIPEEIVYLVTYDAYFELLDVDRLYLHVEEELEIPEDLELSIKSEEGIEFTLPGDIPIFGGATFEFDIEELELPYDIEVTPEGYTISIGTAIAEDALEKRKKEHSYKMYEWPKGGKERIWLIEEQFGMDLSFGGSLFCDGDEPKFKGTLTLNFEAVGECQKQLIVGGFIPVIVTLEVTGELQADGSLTLDLTEGAKEKLSGALSFAAKLALELYAGIGCEYASVGIYGGAGLNYEMTIFPVKKFGPDFLSLEGELGLRGVLFRFSADLELVSGEFVIYNRKMPTSQSAIRGTAMSMEEVQNRLSDLSQYTMIQRGDMSARTAWMGSSLTANDNEIQLLQGGVYKGENLQFVNVGGSPMLFYNDDDLSQSVANGSKVAFAQYADGTFASPIHLSASQSGQYGFDVYEGEDAAYVVWQESKKVMDETVSLQEVADSLELKVAKVDVGGNVTSLGTITDNDILEAKPQITETDGQICVTWIENSENDIIGIKGTNTIKKAFYENGTWVQGVVTEGLSKISEIDAGEVGDDLYVAYASENGSGIVSLATGEGMSLGAMSNPQFGYVGGDSALVWYENAQVRATKDCEQAETLFTNEGLDSRAYKYISDRNGNSGIVFTATFDGKAQMYATNYDANAQQWGEIQPITDQADYLENVTGVYQDSQMLLSFYRTKAEVEAGVIDASSDLCCMKLPSRANLEILDVAYYLDEIAPGGIVNLEILLANKGVNTAQADDLQISVYNENEKEVLSCKSDKSIKAGTQETVIVPLQLPYTLSVSGYTVKVMCNGVVVEQKLDLGVGDLCVSARTYASESFYEVEATVENLGIEPAGGKLVFINKADDSVLAEREFEELDYSERAIETYIVPKELYDGSAPCSIVVKVVSESEQIDTQNDRAVVYLPKQTVKKPCLVTFDYAIEGYEKVQNFAVEGGTVAFPEEPVVEGYKFLGWYYGETQFTQEMTVSTNMRLKAKYEKLPEASDPGDKPSDTPTDKPSDKPTDKPSQDNDKEGTTVKAVPKKNSKTTINNITYKVTKSDAKKGTVEVTKVKAKKTKVTVPKTVKIDGYTFKVTSIGKNAFKNNKKVKTVIIGENVTNIGKSAFYNCKNLKTIKINSTKLKTVGKNALKGIHKKATIKVPSKKLKAYKKLFKKKGQKSTVQIKKK